MRFMSLTGQSCQPASGLNELGSPHCLPPTYKVSLRAKPVAVCVLPPEVEAAGELFLCLRQPSSVTATQATAIRAEAKGRRAMAFPGCSGWAKVNEPVHPRIGAFRRLSAIGADF